MLAWAIPITGEGISGGGERPDNALPPWLPATGPGGGGGAAPPQISLPIVLPPPGVTLPPGTPVGPGDPTPPDNDRGGWAIVYTPEGGWQFIRLGEIVDAIKASRPQPK